MTEDELVEDVYIVPDEAEPEELPDVKNDEVPAEEEPDAGR
jgi:hypothetical protein